MDVHYFDSKADASDGGKATCTVAAHGQCVAGSAEGTGTSVAEDAYYFDSKVGAVTTARRREADASGQCKSARSGELTRLENATPTTSTRTETFVVVARRHAKL